MWAPPPQQQQQPAAAPDVAGGVPWRSGQAGSSAVAGEGVPSTDSLLSRYGLRSGDSVVGRFLVGEGSDAAWYRGVLTYNTVRDPRFDHCVYKVLFEDGETLFYEVDYMRQQLETGNIRKHGE